MRPAAHLLAEVPHVPSMYPQQLEAEMSLLWGQSSDVFHLIITYDTCLAWFLPPSGHWGA